MKEQLISFETAKLAKEKGFDVDTIEYYTPKGYQTESEGYRTERLERTNWNNGKGSYPTLSKDVECSAPTQSLLQKWLRESHKIYVEPRFNSEDFAQEGLKAKVQWYCWVFKPMNYESENETSYNTYEEALEKGLIQGLKLIK